MTLLVLFMLGAGTTSGSYGTGTGSGTGSGPGFWTGKLSGTAHVVYRLILIMCPSYYSGAATGGMLGYLFGNRGK